MSEENKMDQVSQQTETQEEPKFQPAKIILKPEQSKEKEEPKVFDKDYVEKLRNEAAEKRIRVKQAEEKASKLEKELNIKLKTFDEIQEQLSELQKEKEERDLAGASDIEKLTRQLEKLANQVNDYKGQIEEKDKIVSQLSEKTKIQDRKIMIDRLAQAQGIQFASKYERDGFVRNLLEKDDDGEFIHNEESIVYEMSKFKKTRVKVPETPAPGNNNKMSEVPDIDRLNTLLSKDREELTDKELKEMDEILNRIEERQKK